MCHSPESSIFNYIIVLGLAAGLAYFGDATDQHVALLFATLIHMQLAEYFMWMDQKCGQLNQLATYFAYFTLWVQSLSALLGGLWLQTIQIPFIPAIGFAGIFTLFMTIQWFRLVLKPGKRCSLPSPKNLMWDLDNVVNNYIFLIPYLTMLIGTWLFSKDRLKGIIVFGLILWSFFAHYIQYGDEWASSWCYSTRNGLIYYICLSLFVRLIRKQFPLWVTNLFRRFHIHW
jgi:hypothetical protein